LHIGLKRLADMAGKNSMPRIYELPALDMGVRTFPLVPD
jgi:hypothetical protein